VIDRVSYVEGGDLEKLLQYARGVVLTNSTVGMHALIQGCPVKVLGCAVFDIEGLAHRGSLDSFWGNPTKPDPELTNALVRALAGTVQVKGSFFDPIGRADAIKVFVERLTRGTVNSSGAYVKPAPRRQTVRSPNQDC